MFTVPARSDARANRQRLLDVAYEIFREQGLDAEMKLIAERAEVGIGTIYRNFPTKDDLIAALVTDMIERLSSICDRADEEPDPERAVVLLIEGSLNLVAAYGQILMATKQRGLPEECMIRFSNLDPRGRIMRILERGVAQGIFHDDIDPNIASALIENSVYAPTYHSLRDTLEHEQITRGIVEHHLRALRK